LFGVEPDERAQRELTRLRLEPAGRQLDVLAPERVLDVGDGELARGERLAVDPHAHRVATPAIEENARDAGHRRESVDEIPLDVVGRLERRHRVGAEAEEHDRLGARVGLDDLRRIGLIGQRVRDARNSIADVVRRRVDVAIDVELDAHLRALVLAVRLDLENAFDARDRILDQLRDLGFDDGSGRAAVFGGDGNDRTIDIRVLAHLQALQRHETEDHEQQADDDREDRTPDGGLGNAHLSRSLRAWRHPSAAASPDRSSDP